MSKVIGVFGAGTGLGTALARKFGQQGYKVALVARREQPLRDLATEFSRVGIEAVPFAADLSDHHAIPGLVNTIKARLGPLDVVEYSPITTAPFIPAGELTPEVLERYVRLYLLSPVALINSVLPEMRVRRAGAILVTHGGTAAHPIPFMSGVGPIMAATRNLIYALNGELAGTGVFAGTLTISSLILGSAGHKAIMSGELPVPDPEALPTVNPDDLADVYWKMTVDRDRAEATWPPQPS